MSDVQDQHHNQHPVIDRPDLWWEVENEAEWRIVIIEHTVPFETAKERTGDKHVNVFHRFM